MTDDMDAHFVVGGNDGSSSDPDELCREVERLKQVLSLLQGPLAHELRTPINTVMGFAGILLMESDGSLTEEQKKHVRFIEDAARELLGMTNELFELTRTVSPQQRRTPNLVSLDDLLNEAVQFSQSLSDARNVDVEIMSSRESVHSDPRLCRQIVRSIVSALFRLTENDCIEMTTRSDTREATIQFDCQQAVLNAAGMADLFVPFSRLAVGKDFAVVGLGFFLARQLADYLDGAFLVTSLADEPLTLQLRLPDLESKD